MEPIILARRPLIGTVIENVATHGTGAMNIDASRIGWGEEGNLSAARHAAGYSEAARKALGSAAAAANSSGFTGEVVGSDASAGRWPANLVLVHHPDCRPTDGTRPIKGSVAGPASPGAFGTGDVYGDGPGGSFPQTYANEDGIEEVPEWVCVPGCPVAELDAQSGEAGSFLKGDKVYDTPRANNIYGDLGQAPMWGYGDTGGAARFFAQFSEATDEDAPPGAPGRFPANFVLVHHPDCRPTNGTRTVASATHYPASRGKGGIGNDGHSGQDDLTEVSARTEEVAEWVCVEGCPVAALDAQSGDLPEGVAGPRSGHGDTGGASRFFARFGEALGERIAADGPVRYVAKAPGKERPTFIDTDGEFGEPGARIVHNTVKPLALVQYLIKLVTPPGGVVLDPFTGSGTAAEAAVLEGFEFVGVELTPKYLPLIEQRIARGYRGGPDYPDPVDAPARPDDGTRTLFDL